MTVQRCHSPGLMSVRKAGRSGLASERDGPGRGLSTRVSLHLATRQHDGTTLPQALAQTQRETI
jgi:hypothetical protein